MVIYGRTIRLVYLAHAAVMNCGTKSTSMLSSSLNLTGHLFCDTPKSIASFSHIPHKPGRRECPFNRILGLYLVQICMLLSGILGLSDISGIRSDQYSQ